VSEYRDCTTGTTTRAITLFLALSIGTPLLAQRELKDIPDPHPQVELESFTVADGFEVQLFAAEPLVAKPIQIAFDEEGRLWVASSRVYPQIRPGQSENDKILVLEDLDGDGTADRTTVFADDLLMPTGVLPGDGGVYVALGSELVHLRDTDNDGVADRRRTVLSGFGLEDTHHIFHTLRWGPDGRMYFHQSYYIQTHVETPYGVRRLDGGGIWQFDPKTGRLEVFSRGMVNSWGHRIDFWGQSLATDGAYGDGLNFVFPGATFVASPGTVRKLRGLNPGNPKHAGLERLTGRHIPPAWRDRWITADFRANRINSFSLSEDGSGYAGRKGEDLIQSTHVAFRPVDMTMGPDGAIYISDWYNPIIQHGEVNFKDTRRDHVHGRIWRISAKGRALLPRPRLKDASVERLLDGLRAPEGWTRRQARRLLRERGSALVLPELKRWIAKLDGSASNIEQGRLEALWLHQSLGVVEPQLLASLLRSSEPRARAAAVRVLASWNEDIDDATSLLSTAVLDEHPRVRLEAVLALGNLPSAHAAEIALRALDSPMDRWLDYALWWTVRALGPYWVPRLKSGELSIGADSRRLGFALQSVDSPAVVDPLLALLKSGKLTGERERNALDLIASLGKTSHLAELLSTACADDASPERAEAIIRVLEIAASRGAPRPVADVSGLALLLDAPSPRLRGSTAKLAGRWKLEALRPKITLKARARGRRPERKALLESLALFGDEASRAVLLELTSSTHAPAARLDALVALASLDVAAAAEQAADVLNALGPKDVPAALIHAFLERENGPASLAEKLEGRTLPADIARLCVRAARTSALSHDELIAALSRAGSLAASSWKFTRQELAAFLAEVRRDANAHAGEAVFRRSRLACLTCHAVAGAGGRVGPDLSSLGASAPVDYIVESLIDPGKQIKENYPSLVVVTRDGRVLTGVRVASSKNELVLRMADDTDLSVPAASVLSQAPGGSLMPAGLVDELTRVELRDLVGFLSSVGRPDGGFEIGRERVVRRWEFLGLHGASARQISSVDTLPASLAASAEWKSIYSTVGGKLPHAELIRDLSGGHREEVILLRFGLEVSTPGAVRLKVNFAGVVRAFVGSSRVTSLTLTLERGLHTVTLALAKKEIRSDLRVELVDAPGSTAKARIVTGK
jgi:putative heme-binding domain-containing protein